MIPTFCLMRVPKRAADTGWARLNRMTLLPAKTTQCPVPPDFDHEAYGAIGRRLGAFSEERGWDGYASGFNAVAFRFAAAEEAHERFSASLSGADALSPAGPRYTQEEALFTFFVNAVSVIECLYFALYNIGACLGSAAFHIHTPAELRAVHIVSTVKAFQAAFPDDGLTSELARVAESGELRALKEHRDFLTHRGTPKRTHVVEMGLDRRVDMSAVTSATITSNPKDVPSAWISNMHVTPAMTKPPRSWLATTVNGLLRSADAFLAERGA